MFTPLLITGKDLQNSLIAIIPDLDIPHPDRIWFNKDEQVIDVDSLRSLDEHFLLPPYQSPQKILIVHRLDLASETVQNMLLKKLEEPPSWLQLYVTALHAYTLLPTILSRVDWQPSSTGTLSPFMERTSSPPVGGQIRVANQQLTTSQLANNSTDQLIKLAEQLKERHQALDATYELLEEHIALLSTQPSLNITNNIRRLQTTLKLLQSNTNVRLSMEWCLFGLQ